MIINSTDCQLSLQFLMPLALFIPTTFSFCEDTKDSRPLINDVVTALGGPEKLLRNFRMKEQFHSGAEPTLPPGKSPGTRESYVESPGFWWLKKTDRTDEPAKFALWAWTLVPLLDAKSKITVVPDVIENEKAVMGLRVSETITPPLELYFDKTTKLLVRIDWRSDIYRFSDWKEHDDVKYPAKSVLFKKSTGKPWFYHEITELERLKAIPADLPR